jgi:hypothetical protein
MITNMIRLADEKGYKKDDLRGIIDDSRSMSDAPTCGIIYNRHLLSSYFYSTGHGCLIYKELTKNNIINFINKVPQT